MGQWVLHPSFAMHPNGAVINYNEDSAYSLVDLGTNRSHKNNISHIDASLSRQPLVKGERLVRHEVNAVMDMGPSLGNFFKCVKRPWVFYPAISASLFSFCCVTV